MPALRVGTRASALARWQTAHVVGRLRALPDAPAIEVVELTTTGDDRPELAIERLEETGLFTSTLERALLAGGIDLAVHSCKDLPVEPTPGLVVAALPPRGAAADALCARAGARLAQLPPGARVGTSSLRRIAQLRALRPDLELLPLRGNVPTRLERVARGELAAVVLARAGLERLGREPAITEAFDPDTFLPAPAQGALAVQARAGDRRAAALLAPLDHAPTRRAVTAERAVLHALHGGCSVPVGAHAQVHGEGLVLSAGVFGLADGAAVRVRLAGSDPGALGLAAARELLARGAGPLLEAARAGAAAPSPTERA